jgi:hypothetical protein
MKDNKTIFVDDLGSELENEHLRKNRDNLQKELDGASVDDIVQPEVWQYLSPKLAGQLRRWVNQFIKANTEQNEKLAIPFMNKKLRRRIAEINLILRKNQIEKEVK